MSLATRTFILSNILLFFTLVSSTMLKSCMSVVLIVMEMSKFPWSTDHYYSPVPQNRVVDATGLCFKAFAWSPALHEMLQYVQWEKTTSEATADPAPARSIHDCARHKSLCSSSSCDTKYTYQPFQKQELLSSNTRQPHSIISTLARRSAHIQTLYSWPKGTQWQARNPLQSWTR